MKIKNLFIAMMVFAGAITFNSCVDDNDYSIPKIEIKDLGLKANKTIADIKAMYSGGVVDFKGKDYIIEGYVTSSDEGGNIFKALYIQDKPENPTSAIQIIIEDAGLYNRYEVGRKVFVKLDGLAISQYKGMLQLGQLQGGLEVKRIASTMYKKNIILSPVKAKIVPLELNVSDIKDNHLGMLIKLNNMRPETKGLTYADAGSTFGANRTFLDCKGKDIIMRNSGYASFKAEIIPSKRGSITGILGKYDTTLQLLIRDTEDVNLTLPYDCNGAVNPNPTPTESVDKLDEGFDAITKTYGEIKIKGWTVQNTKGTKRKWSGYIEKR